MVGVPAGASLGPGPGFGTLIAEGAGSCRNSHFSGDLVVLYLSVQLILLILSLYYGCDSCEIKRRKRSQGNFPIWIF